MTSPETAGSKTKIDWQEIAITPVESAQIAYHGLMARIHDIRANVTDSRISELDHFVDFTTDLAKIGQNVVDEKLPHDTGHNIGFVVHDDFPRPPEASGLFDFQGNPIKPPKVSGFLDSQAETIRRTSPRSNKETPKTKDAERPLNLSDLSGTLPVPQTPQEREMLNKSTKDMRTVRNQRSEQTSYGKIIGGAGIRSGTLTKWKHFQSRMEENREIKSGAIDIIEAHKRKATSVPSIKKWI